LNSLLIIIFRLCYFVFAGVTLMYQPMLVGRRCVFFTNNSRVDISSV
jgi:hypothetical protein